MEQFADAVHNILSWLVSFDTVTREGAAHCQDELAERFRQQTPNIHLCDFGNGRNLIVHFGHSKSGGVMLAGHVDVVPVANQAWSHDPFVTYIKNGKIFGRGTTDMKGFVACILAMAPEFERRSETCPITICLTPDEETTFEGAKALPTQLEKLGIIPLGAIVGEPTELCIGTDHPGFVDMESVFTGVSAHSSRQDLGANAIYAAAAFVTRLAELDKLFGPEGSRISVGCIKGGSARNIVAEYCTVDWEIRHKTVSPVVGLLRALEVIKSQSNVSRSDHALISANGLMADSNSAFFNRVNALFSAANPVSLPFATEAGIYQSAGIPSIVCGPGSIEQAHKPDEFIEISQLKLCLKMLAKIQKI